MKEQIVFEIVKFFKLLLLVIFIMEIKNGFFKGLWATLKKVVLDYKWVITVYAGFVVFIMFFIDAPVVRFWQTKAFQNKIFYYFGLVGNLLGDGDYLFSFLVTVIVIAKLYNRERIRKMFSLALTSSVTVGIINTFIKLVTTRKRPDIYDPNPFRYESYSFNMAENFKLLKGDHSMPSGHVAVSVAAFFTLGFLTKNRVLRVICFILPLITVFARTYFSKHWVSDAAVSVLLAGLFSIAIYRLYKDHNETI